MFIPTALYSWTLVSDGASKLVTMFRNERSSENGVNGISLELILARSCMSLFRRASVVSLCWSLVVYVRLFKSCIAMLYFAVTGMDIVQSERCSSFIPLSCVKPSLVLRDLISVRSITRSELSPAQNVLLLLTTCRPFTNFKYISGCLFSSYDISCK